MDTLPNTFFQDFPIEFKEINPEDFPEFDTSDKIIISPNNEGYIDEELQSHIDLEEKNTVVINAAVGQGKTYSIIQIIKRYFEAEEDYMIFVAAPYTSLVQQYYNKISDAGIPQEEIYIYDSIGNNRDIDAWDSHIQLLTVNALLGNPGNDALVNKPKKRSYLNYLVGMCEKYGRKAVFVYDEIHDAIHNFKEELIFNLWKWRNVIHKNILLSATYNEASKIVIEYLAELTDDKIKIIESERVRFPEKQSDLYLHFNPAQRYSYKNDGIVSLVEKLVEQGKNIDILLFSKKLADDICNETDEGVGKVLLDAGADIHNCTAEPDGNQSPYGEVPKNRYRADKCNIGTNFKSGVSIEKENHAYIVIMPSLGTKRKFKNKFGVFTDGINSVIQAIARQRTKGEIHIILYPPDRFDMDTLPFDDETKKEAFEESYSKYQNYRSDKTDLVEYIPLNQQDVILKDFYENTLHAEISPEESYIKSVDRNGRVRLEYPSYKLFKLTKGEKYLSSKIKFFGKDLSSYVTYAAITNQFVNCKFSGTNIENVLFFTEGEIQSKLEEFFSDYLDEETLNSLLLNVTDAYKYHEIKNTLFQQYKVLYKSEENDEYEELRPYSNKQFEKQFIAFLQRKFHRRNRSFSQRFSNNNNGYRDAEYTRGEYFRACIAQAIKIQESGETTPLVEAYLSLNYFREKVYESKETHGSGNNQYSYFSSSPDDSFISNDLFRFRDMKETLISEDPFLANKVFTFSNSFIRQENRSDEAKQIQVFYKLIKKDFFVTEPKKINTLQVRGNMSKIIRVIDIPSPNDVIDMLSPTDITIPLDNLPNIADLEL